MYLKHTTSLESGTIIYEGLSRIFLKMSKWKNFKHKKTTIFLYAGLFLEGFYETLFPCQVFHKHVFPPLL